MKKIYSTYIFIVRFKIIQYMKNCHHFVLLIMNCNAGGIKNNNKINYIRCALFNAEIEKYKLVFFSLSNELVS